MLAKFHREKGWPLELPVSENTVLEFVHWLIFTRGLSAASISGYLAGIKKLHIVKGLQEPKLRSSLIQMVIEGKKNMEAASRQEGGGKRQATSGYPFSHEVVKSENQPMVRGSDGQTDDLDCVFPTVSRGF
jgi:hypothetical protein